MLTATAKNVLSSLNRSSLLSAGTDENAEHAFFLCSRFKSRRDALEEALQCTVSPGTYTGGTNLRRKTGGLDYHNPPWTDFAFGVFWRAYLNQYGRAQGIAVPPQILPLGSL